MSTKNTRYDKTKDNVVEINIKEDKQRLDRLWTHFNNVKVTYGIGSSANANGDIYSNEATTVSMPSYTNTYVKKKSPPSLAKYRYGDAPAQRFASYYEEPVFNSKESLLKEIKNNKTKKGWPEN